MPTARVSENALNTLRELAAKTGRPYREILDEALETLRRQHFLQEANQAYGALRANTEEWEAESEERAAWDSTLADDLAED